jgi:nitrogen fixation/metabolism regulation signal transduction histidine kinase
MSKPTNKLMKPAKFMQQHVENGINLSVQAIEEYLKAYNAAKANKKQLLKTFIMIVLSNLATLFATAFGVG